ncbi:uncharacterized protein LOC112905398 isoform X2 [Agrilus planipennis]|uniref:Uncharacterized protein LOC112905398 isoform X2 n=1 Tax=Agrilus planipennis TaxID=224129 RepID=A0A7F5RC35_AGRPL|nr:uncharacterized protein LOC112905398 isoform X2 [Agrilus planipennis]
MNLHQATVGTFLYLTVNPCFGGSSQLRCYYCDASILSACDDPPVKAVLPSVECREPPAHVVSRDGQSVTDFVLSRSRDGQFNGVTLVTNILLREIPREAELTDQEYTFYCGKITLKSGDNESMQRRCLPVKKDILDVCNFIKEEIDERIQVTGCSLCDADLCNSSNKILISCTLILFNMIRLFIF